MTTWHQPMVDITDTPHDGMTESWQHSRWEKDTRYYELRVQQDLFGNWLLTRVWGRKGSAMGQLRHDLCVDQAEANTHYAAAEVRREQRGYSFIYAYQRQARSRDKLN